MKPNNQNRINGRGKWAGLLLIALVLMLATTTLAIGENQSQKLLYLSVEKPYYTVGEKVTLIITADNLNDYDMSIYSDQNLYKYGGELKNNIDFYPGDEGAYRVELTSKTSQVMVDAAEFIVGMPAEENNSQGQNQGIEFINVNGTANETGNEANNETNATDELGETNQTNQSNVRAQKIFTDKGTYFIGEPVVASVNLPSDEQQDYKLYYEYEGFTQRYIGDFKEIMFVPRGIGTYYLVLRSNDNNEIERHEFKVLPSALPQPSPFQPLSHENASQGAANGTCEQVLTPESYDNKILRLVSSKGLIGRSNIKFYDRQNNEINLNEISLNGSNATLGIRQAELAEIIPENRLFKKITLRKLWINISQNISLGIDEIPFNNIGLGIGLEKKNIVKAFAVDASALNFTNGTITGTATGTELWKCKEWNFETQECLGTWSKIMDLVPGQDYELEISPDDPGYAETAITILNLQSYPTVGGNWTVQFNTTGTGDLEIRAANGTTWSAANENNDLKFLEIKCGDIQLAYEWVNDSVFIANYSCNQTSYEISKVLTKGKHTIEFRFGNDTKYAYNNASDPWWNVSWLYRIPINITEQGNTNLTNYQINLSIDTESAIAASKMNGDCSDVRFVYNASNELSFYLDSGCDAADTKILVKVNLTANRSSIVYMYYGNPYAGSASNGTATFEFFDDFDDGSVDTSKWNVGGGMTESGGVASGTTSGTDYFFGKIRININTTTLVRMSSHSTTGVARPGVLQTNGNPYSVPGFGWQDWTDNYRYTDTYDTGVTQNYNYYYGTRWDDLESTWTASSVVFTTNGALTRNHTTQIPNSTRVLYGQVDGNADYDLFYTRKYVPSPPSANAGLEEIINISPTISDIQCYDGADWVDCATLGYGYLIQHVRANCTSNIGGTIQNATFALINIEDDHTYFNEIVTESTNGYWQDSSVNAYLYDSGMFNLRVTCSDNMYTNATDVNWSIPFGTLSAQLIWPNASANVTVNKFFSFTSSVTCSRGECGYVNATLDPTSWWNYSWKYKKQVNLSVGSGSTPAGYQVKLVLNSSTVGANWNWSRECVNNNGSRFRFVNGSEAVELPYWVENCSVASQNMTVWVKIDQNITTSNYSIYLYYGNPSASNASNGTATFDFFDDATGTYSDKWTNTEGVGNYGTVSGKRAINLSSATTNIRTLTYQNSGAMIIEADLYATAVITAIQYYQDSNPATNERYHARLDVRNGEKEAIVEGGAFTGNQLNVSWTASAWVPAKLVRASNASHYWYVENLLGDYKVNDTTYTSGYLALNHHNTGTGAVANLRVRKYASAEPSSTFGNEQWASTKGIMPMNNGTPFYTNVSNPMYSDTTSCLANMGDGSTCNTTWTVNTTGAIGTTWAFFTIYSSMNYSSNVSTVNSTNINITIIDNAAPNVSSIFILPSNPNYATDLNCNFTVTDANTLDTLTANVSWYRNNTSVYSEIVGVSNGVSVQRTLGSGNLTAGEVWYCSATPYDGTSYGNQANSSNVTILSVQPPVINRVQCQKNGATWGNCSAILYGSILTAVRVNCTDADGTVTNVTFNLTNIEDSKSFFNGTTANTTSGYYVFNNNDITINDSGTFNLSIACYDSDNTSTIGYSQWNVPWGKLAATLIDPLTNRSVAQNRFFSFTSRVTCSVGECGYVNATLDPTGPWWDYDWRYKAQINLSVGSGSTPADYQAKLVLNSSTVGANWNWSSECVNNTGSRFRFVNGSEAVELPYWVENCSVTNQNMTVWVKVDQNITTSNYSIYLYYGNAQATNNSNGTATFDFFDVGDQVSSWTINAVAGQNATFGNPAPSYYAVSNSGNYMYRDVSLTTNKVVEFNVQSNYLGNFYFLTNSGGAGQHMRIETRDTYSNGTGIAAASSWTSWTAPFNCDDLDNNTWYTFRLVIGSTTVRAYINNTACGGAYSFTNNGGYIGLVGDGGGPSYTTWLDNLRVRKYAISDPSASYGAEQMTSFKGIIPMNSGNPFYTNVSNPMYSDTKLCLANMGAGSTCDTTWTVNATGPINTSYEFFTTYKSMNYSAYVAENDTPTVNINITDSVSPTISSILCLKNGASWVNCTTIAFGNTITSVKANCTSNMEGTINNVSFMLKNINDNYVYFNTTVTSMTNGSWINNNTNLTVYDSGGFNLHVTCIESPLISEQDANWSIPFGTLTARLISPNSSINVTQNAFFNFTAQINCSGGECGYVNATLDPVSWWNPSWYYRALINITEKNNTDLIGFQVNLSLNTSGLISGGKMNGDCSDMRFVDNASNVLSHYVESGCNTSATKIWVKTNLTANSSKDIYMYYGNPSAGSESNGTATFEFFDDFDDGSVDTSKWNVGGTMTESGGVVSGATSETDYLFGKTRINIDTITYIKIRNKATSGIARPGVLQSPGNPYSIPGFGWQDYSNNYRYTDTYDTTVNQVQRNTFNTNWYILETIWRTNNVTFIVNGSVLGVHTTQIPNSTRVLYGQVEGNASYDLFYTRKFMPLAPTYTQGSEATAEKGDVPMNSGTPFYTITQNPANSSTVPCLANMISGSSCNTTWTVNATGTQGSTWEFYVKYAPMNYSSNVSNVTTPHVNITITNNFAPNVSSIFIVPPDPSYMSDLNCTFTVVDANYFDTLTANVSWYKNGVLSYSEVVGVPNNVQTRRTLSSGNITAGEVWYCAVTPYDGLSYGTQANSSNVTILSSLPPRVNNIQCQENGSPWGACSNIIYNDNLTAVRANCTAFNGSIVNATFTLTNIDHNQTIFTGTTTNNSLGYFVFNNNDATITNSGTYNLSVTCVDNNNTPGYNYTNWTVAWGTLSAQLISPNTSVNVTSNRFFNFTARITCSGGECGYVNATLDPVSWWNSSWLYRKNITLAERSNLSLSDFQVNLSLNTSGLISGGKMNGDCSDMRFVDNASNVLSHYVESGCNTSATKIWVKTNLTANSSNDIYMYYGNPAAANASNGTATFEFFDDFDDGSVDTSKWNVGGTMNESGGVVSGATSETDYLFGKTRINIDTITYIKMRNKATSGVARPGVLQSPGNPFSIPGFGWQDYSDNYRYTDTYYTSVNQVQRNTFNTNWYILETIWRTNNVTFIVNGSVLGIHTTQIPISTQVLYAQVEGNASYDLIYTRKYAPISPTNAVGAEVQRGKGDIPMNSGTPFYTITQNPADSSTFYCLANMAAGSSCNTTWTVNATGPAGSKWEFYAIYAATNFSSYVNSANSTRVNLTIINNIVPNVTAISLTPQYPILTDNLNCTFKIVDSSPLDALSANVTWYKNGAYNNSIVVSATSGVSTSVFLGPGNLTLGNVWHCGVIPQDQDAAGAQVNSSNVTILGARPPSVNQLQCYENNSVWENCSSLAFGDVFSGVRANCTSEGQQVTNVTFNLTNVPHAYTYFHNASTSNGSDWWEFYTNITLNYSGEYQLYTACYNNNSDNITTLTNWTIPWGTLVANRTYPTSNINVQRYELFNFSANISCVGGECGNIIATVDPVAWWDINWKYRKSLNITERNNTNLTGYQINLNVNTSGLISGGKVNGDCSDLRFVDNASNVLNYYINSSCNTSSTTVWLRTNLSANRTSTVYMYYGNPAAANASNGTATFEFFDDFDDGSVDTTKWNVGGTMTESGGVVSGATSGTDYLFGKTRINIDTITYIKMRNKATSGVARPGVLQSPGNPFSIPGFGWQDYSNNYRYTDTYDTTVNQVQRNTFNTNWYILETIWRTNNVTFRVNGTVLGVHTTQIPTSTYVLYAQVEGNASYDLIYTRKYVPVVPTYVFDAEIQSKGDVPMNSGTPFYTITQNPANSSTFPCLDNMIAGMSCPVTWSINATGAVNTVWNFFAYFNSSNFPAYVSTANTTHINITITDSGLMPPVVTLQYPNNNSYTSNATVEFNCSATDNTGLSNMTLYLKYKLGLFLENGTNDITGTYNSTTFPRTLQEGGYIWNCLAYDIDGNYDWANSNRTLTIDYTAPTINLSAPADAETINESFVILNFTVRDNVDSTLNCNITIDSTVRDANFTANASGFTNRTIGNQTPGNHYWNVTCWDDAQNVNWSITRTYTIANFAPNVTLVTANNVSQQSTTITLQYNATDSINISFADLYINGVANATNYTVGNGEISSFTVEGLAEGRHNWTVNVTNTNNLTAQAPVRWFTIDYTPPSINLSAPPDNSSINQSNATFKFTAIDNINDTLTCNITVNSIVRASNFNATFGALTSKNISNLSNGINYWNVTCWDKAGNVNTSDTWHLNVSAPPTVVLNAPYDNYSQTSADIVLNYTPTDASGFGQCDLYINDQFNQSNSTPVSNGIQNSFSLFSLSPGRYNWTVNCTNTIGLSAIATPIAFSVDIVGPTITLNGPQPNQTVYNQTILFNYTAVDDFTPILHCNLTLDGSVNVSNISSANNYSVNVSVNMTTQATHYWNVTCWDDAGNTNVSETRNFTNRIPPTVTLSNPGINATLNYSQNVVFSYVPFDSSGLQNSSLIINGVINQTDSTPPANGFTNYFYLNLTDGVYTWTVNATNTVGLTGTAEVRNLTIDTAPPIIVYDHPYDSEVMGWNNVTFNFTAVDNLSNNMTCNVTVNGILEYTNMNVTNGTPVIFNKILSDGNYNWSVTCLDKANWTNSYTLVNFTVDAPPNVTLNWPIDYYRNKSIDITLNYTPRDAIGIQNCTLFYDGVMNTTEIMIQKNQPNYFPLVNLPEGQHNWTVQCIDAAPDFNPYTPPEEFFIIDLTGPNITLFIPNEGDYLSANVIFNWTAVDYNNTYINCSLFLDSKFNRSLNQLSGTNFNTTIYNLSDGPHNWTVNCSDNIGNWNVSETRNFTINQPDMYIDSSRISFNNTNPNLNQNITIRANVTNMGGVTVSNVLVEFWDNGMPGIGIFIGNATATVAINASVIFNTTWIITSGYHTIYVLVDPQGTIAELDETNNNATTTISALFSNITYPSNNSLIQNNTPRLDFNVTDYTTNNITYKIYVDGAFNNQTGNVTSGSNTSITLNNLSDGVHLIKVQATDILNRSKNSTTLNITIDITSPIVNFKTRNESWFNYSTPIIYFNISDSADTNINYSVYVNGAFLRANNVSNYTMTNETLDALLDGAYNITIQATDDAGNAANYTRLIYVDTAMPGISPTYPADSANFTNNRTVILNFTATDNLDTNLTCNLTLDGAVNRTNFYAQNASEINTTINGLAEGTHYWNVTCWDHANNTNTSETRSFNIYISPNVTLSFPANNNVSGNSTQIFLFNASDETGIFNCSLLFNGIINTTRPGSEIINNGISNFTLTGMNGIYNWSVTCFDNTSFKMQGNSTNRNLTVDTSAPYPNITTANYTWFNTSTPLISFIITDDYANPISYTFYVNNSPNVSGSIGNNTPTGTQLQNITPDGTFSIVLQANDNAWNYRNSSSIMIYVDTAKPNINLTAPENGLNINGTSVQFNFSATDNMANYTMCNLTISNGMHEYNINATNNTIQAVNKSGLIAGTFFWNVSCIDLASNRNTSETRNFTIRAPDLLINSGNISFSNSTPEESTNITVYANIFNQGGVTAYNITVQFWKGDPNAGGTQINGNKTIDALNSGSNFTVNVTYNVSIGYNQIFAVVDPPTATNGSLMEENESNNKANNSFRVGLYQVYAGNTSGFIDLEKQSVNISMYIWNMSSVTGSNIFVTDLEANPGFSNLQAIGINTTNGTASNDFTDIDTALGTTAYPDSINNTFTSGGAPKAMKNFTVFTRPISNVPIINSTNTSSFVTGILWDTSDGGAQYNGTQDIIFNSEINQSQQGIGGIYDFEIKVPALLRNYKGAGPSLAFYYELK